MNTLQLEFDLIINNKYKELKNECETYANLRMAIERYCKDIAWEGDVDSANYIKNELIKRLKKETEELFVSK